MHRPKANIERPYIKRENDRRGLIQEKFTYKTTAKGLRKYLDPTRYWTIQLANVHKKQKKSIQLVKKAIRWLKKKNSISLRKKNDKRSDNRNRNKHQERRKTTKRKINEKINLQEPKPPTWTIHKKKKKKKKKTWCRYNRY